MNVLKSYKKKGEDITLTAALARTDNAELDSLLEADFLRLVRSMQLPEPLIHHEFAKPRSIHFDFAWPRLSPPLGVEMQGHPSHRTDRYEADMEKISLGASLGWRVLTITPRMMEKKGFVYNLLRRAFSTSGENLIDLPPRAFTEIPNASVDAYANAYSSSEETKMPIPLDSYLSGGKSLNASKIKELGLHNSTFTIRDVREIEFPATDDRPAEKKIGLDFEEVEESLTLNKTNLKFLRDAFGGNTDDWFDKRINLIIMPVTMNGKNIDSVRIIEAPRSAAAAQAASNATRERARKAADPTDETDPFADGEG